MPCLGAREYALNYSHATRRLRARPPPRDASPPVIVIAVSSFLFYGKLSRGAAIRFREATLRRGEIREIRETNLAWTVNSCKLPLSTTYISLLRSQIHINPLVNSISIFAFIPGYPLGESHIYDRAVNAFLTLTLG